MYLNCKYNCRFPKHPQNRQSPHIYYLFVPVCQYDNWFYLRLIWLQLNTNRAVGANADIVELHLLCGANALLGCAQIAV